MPIEDEVINVEAISVTNNINDRNKRTQDDGRVKKRKRSLSSTAPNERQRLEQENYFDSTIDVQVTQNDWDSRLNRNQIQMINNQSPVETQNYLNNNNFYSNYDNDGYPYQQEDYLQTSINALDKLYATEILLNNETHKNNCLSLENQTLSYQVDVDKKNISKLFLIIKKLQETINFQQTIINEFQPKSDSLENYNEKNYQNFGLPTFHSEPIANQSTVLFPNYLNSTSQVISPDNNDADTYSTYTRSKINSNQENNFAQQPIDDLTASEPLAANNIAMTQQDDPTASSLSQNQYGSHSTFFAPTGNLETTMTPSSPSNSVSSPAVIATSNQNQKNWNMKDNNKVSINRITFHYFSYQPDTQNNNKLKFKITK